MSGQQERLETYSWRVVSRAETGSYAAVYYVYASGPTAFRERERERGGREREGAGGEREKAVIPISEISKSAMSIIIS
jgi:hypothetical protein